MAPKKGQKMSLNAFLEDSSLGSWADEMDSLPSAPAPRADDGQGGFGAGRDYLSTRPDRGAMPPRDDVPLPTQPPYTAFIGNLAFDLTETELETFFGPHQTVSVKIIKDRDDKPKGFGYIEFANVEGLKDALSKNGASFSHRAIRVNVAEPPKERMGGGGFGGGDDEKFSSPWRRDGPLPDRDPPEGRQGSRRGFEGPSDSGVSDQNTDWRGNRPPSRFSQEQEGPPVPRRKASGFGFAEGAGSAAESEGAWAMGSKFKPSQPPDGGSSGSRFGANRGRGDMGPPPQQVEENDWRRGRPAPMTRNNSSPTSTPPTPSSGRRKLELLPRSAAPSAVPSPLSSPKSANAPVHITSTRSNPFGSAKPVDVTQREHLVEVRLEKERAEIHERVQHTMSRQGSRQARERPHAPPSDGARSPSKNSSPLPTASMRSTFSFASAAGGKSEPSVSEADAGNDAEATADEVADKVSELAV